MRVQLDVQPTLLRPGEGETVFDEQRRTLRLLADREELTLTWFRYGPQEEGPDPHVHRLHTDAFYVLEGELELRLGPGAAETVRATAGTLVAAPPEVVHTFRNASDGTAIFLNVHAPSMGFGDMLRARREGRDEDADRFDQFEPPPDGGRPFSDAIISGPDEDERLDRENRLITVKSDLPQVSAFEIAFDDDFEVSPHRHDDQVDSFYVLDGEVEFTLGDEIVRAGPGTWLSAPPGARHGFRNPGPDRARVLNVHTPDAGFADSVRGR
jgi:quercetin dioxygenase-like cupin family protein